MDHFHGSSPFKVNKAFNVPIFIDKYIALVEINEMQQKRSFEKVTTKETKPGTFRDCQCTSLIKAILETTSSLGLATKMALMDCEEIIYV